MSSHDHSDWSDPDLVPDTLLLRLLGAIDQDERATAAPAGQTPVCDDVLPLPPGVVRPSVALARLRHPVEPS